MSESAIPTDAYMVPAQGLLPFDFTDAVVYYAAPSGGHYAITKVVRYGVVRVSPYGYRTAHLSVAFDEMQGAVNAAHALLAVEESYVARQVAAHRAAKGRA